MDIKPKKKKIKNKKRKASKKAHKRYQDLSEEE